MTQPGEPTLQFIGTATSILRLGAFTLLTDPNFLHQGERAYLGHGLSSKRVTEPALSIDELPPLDMVVLSHLHGDHWDRRARRGLDKNLPIVSTRHAARRLRLQGFEHAVALDQWASHEARKGDEVLTVTAMPGRHAPGFAQRLLPPVMGSLIEYRSGPDAAALQIYLTGDTLLIDELTQVRERFPDLDVAVLHLGGTRILGLLVTMDAKQGADLLELIRPPVAVPVHYDDYKVFRSPLEDFTQEVRRRALPGEIRYVNRGDTIGLGH